ncbi:DUF4199 domain-containing protein [Autumnicola psychrophila]|uniref:DUF4199 domain-containing protein n=1 Tax=Autumnicola psychrophila TaxID=3075592 RepID=A0ABU3DSM4_9FLAO|nr:DUF4199 domain-containing protein [Zunongwangia sp. F225]MDT0686726.1 DUF4199 domain-containing protein [Zunongwangia sp. F225]
MKKSVQAVILPYGLYLGLASILISVLIYALNLELFTKWYVTVIGFTVVLVLGIMAVKKAKSLDPDPFFSFKSAFSAFFLPVILGSFISTIFTAILFNVIDPEAAAYVHEMTLEASRDMMERFGAPPSQIDEALAAQADANPFSFQNIFMGFAFTIVLYAILSLLVALIFREKDPRA